MSIEYLASPQFTVNVKFTDAFWWAASSTWKVSGKLPVCVGVPQIQPAQPVAPVFENDPFTLQVFAPSPFASINPVGNVPEVRCHCTNGLAPPVQLSCCS